VADGADEDDRKTRPAAAAQKLRRPLKDRLHAGAQVVLSLGLAELIFHVHDDQGGGSGGQIHIPQVFLLFHFLPP
jgi:hypothetical protein